MAGKIYTVKPSEALNSKVRPTVSMPRRQAEAKTEVTLKDSLIDYVERATLLLLAVFFLVFSAFLAHTLYQYFTVKSHKRNLTQENVYLTIELTRLTSKEVLEEKAKRLGLRPPRESEIIRLQ